MHKPVLFAETMQGLLIKPSGIYIDGTFGRGGHSLGILNQLDAQGRLLAFDKDREAVAAGQQGPFLDARLSVLQGSFTELRRTVEARGWFGKVDGILLDLGVSSPQLDAAERGFSFIQDGPLDMRMNAQQGMSAASWINKANADDIRCVLRDYGEERFSRRIANAIVEERKKAPIETTKQLSEIIKRAHPAWEKRIHPATRSFQGIRIFINHELDELTEVLPYCVDVLAPGGRLCVISFHSLEDRIVKRFIQQHAGTDDRLPGLPIKHWEDSRRLRKVGGLIRPSEAEIDLNPRARSARLRIAEKIK